MIRNSIMSNQAIGTQWKSKSIRVAITTFTSLIITKLFSVNKVPTINNGYTWLMIRLPVIVLSQIYNGGWVFKLFKEIEFRM